jgi:hypothetical protein
MKSIKLFFIVVTSSVLAGEFLQAQTPSVQDSTGLPGDNFSLTGALEMFKKSSSPEEFEKMINTEDNKVNNLDLNGDGDIDYIKVLDKQESDAHALILQAAVSETENQDVAVIELEKTGNENAVLQIVGDEDIYGESMIVEPSENTKQAQASTSNVTVNVWTWPAVRYVYAPAYRPWVSPWGWRARPLWWHPWKPLRWHAFYPYRAPYRHHYLVVHQHRVVHAHRIYTPVRTTSVTVQTRHRASVSNYRATRTTKTVKASNGNREIKATRKTTTVRGNNGKGKATKTTTKVKRRN